MTRGEILGNCQKKDCKGVYVAYKFAGIGSDRLPYYDGRCNKCGDLRCLASPFNKWYKKNHSIL
jgi:hypothetical protein